MIFNKKKFFNVLKKNKIIEETADYSSENIVNEK